MNVKIKANVLKALVDQLSILNDECKWVVTDEGIAVKLVDPAHVAMADLHLEKAAFEEFKPDGDKLDLGVDLSKVREVMKLCKGDEVVSIEHEKEKGKLKFMVGNITRRMPIIDVSGMSDPSIPNLDLPVKVRIDTAHLVQAVKAIEPVCDNCLLTVTMDYFEIKGEGTTDAVELKLPKDLLVSHHCKEAVHSLFPLEYAAQMFRAIQSDEVTIRLGTDYPVKLEFGWAYPPKPKEKGDGKSTLDVEKDEAKKEEAKKEEKSDAPPRGSTTYLLAPRIEGE